MKRSNLQGGIRTPLIVRWPNKIKANTTSDKLVANYDLLPTIAEITGFDQKLNVDGQSFLKELIGKKSKSSHDYLVYSSFEGPTLITHDGWKIRSYLKENVLELYYLPNDFKEENNLANKYPEKLKELHQSLLVACDHDLQNGLYGNKSQISLKPIINN